MPDNQKAVDPATIWSTLLLIATLASAAINGMIATGAIAEGSTMFIVLSLIGSALAAIGAAAVGSSQVIGSAMKHGANQRVKAEEIKLVRANVELRAAQLRAGKAA